MLYGVFALLGLIVCCVGGVVGWLIGNHHAERIVADERQKRAQAEEKCFRLPMVEQSLAKKTSEYNLLNDSVSSLQRRLDDATTRLKEIEPRLSDLAGKVGEKDWQLLQQSIQLEQANRRNIQLFTRLEEEKRTSVEKLSALDQVQRKACRDLQSAFAQVLDRPISPDEPAAEPTPAQPVVNGRTESPSQPVPMLSPEGLTESEQDLIDLELAELDKIMDEQPKKKPESAEPFDEFAFLPKQTPPSREIPDIPRSTVSVPPPAPAAIPIREIPAMEKTVVIETPTPAEIKDSAPVSDAPEINNPG